LQTLIRLSKNKTGFSDDGRMIMSVQIEIHNHYPEFKITLKTVENLVQQLLENEKLPAQELNVILVDDDYLKNLHRNFFNDDTYTDVITFDLSEPAEENIEGEIYISVDRAKFHAGKFHVSLQEEIARLIIHGILHLKGYNDQTAEQRQAMRHQEDYYVKKYAYLIRRF
jgi:rRNA maturation RNase YbeY